MIPSFVSFSGLYSGYLRRCFTGSGLFSQKINIDNETTLHVWGPTNQSTHKPSLVLIHGFGPTAIWQWRKQVQFLAPHFNVYVPDLIFFGESTTRSKERSEKFQAESVGKLLEKLGLKKCHVAGTSYGGIVAYNLAKMLGEERIEKVVICSSGVNMTKNHNVKLLERAGVEKIEDLMLPTSPQNLRKLMTLAVAKSISFMPDFLLKDFLKKLYTENRKEKMELLGGLSLGKIDTSNISPLQQEVLIIWGEDDKIFPVQMAHELKEVISKKARIELIKEASHVPQAENPEEFNNIIFNFLRSSS
ncbi:uncharacterized protein LOC131660716 isoform X2 [Vicia villosa]|uniref:uncharacterized protein LOC131660716 isoform X2 n=1 Tax=Vicia villosa TaxID=3911 RepID=UPI00273BA8C2|nr:uncharacterized protein LOC131660716 isoform X2 [Vicia villosa]